MNIGKLSLLFGAHQVIWHPITVILAWNKLYGIPSLKEVFCIIVHDWGYWNCITIDGKDGKEHPKVGARIARKLLGEEYGELCLLHSRHYAKKMNSIPSKLCWADKYSVHYERWWTYIPRTRLTKEMNEFRLNAFIAGRVDIYSSDKEWFFWLQSYMIGKVREQGLLDK